MSDRKTVYHSELYTPTKLTVKSDALTSKYKKDPNEPGHKYVFIEIGGISRSYFAENQRCANTLASHKDQEITVQAHGKGEDAYIEIDPVPGAKSEPAPESKPAATPTVQGNAVDQAQKVLNKVMNAFWLVEQALQKEMDQALVSKVEAQNLTAENFGGKAGTAFRKLDAAGLIDKLPDIPMWSAEYQNEQRG